MRTVLLLVLFGGAAAGVGCKSSSKKFDLREPHVEEYVPAPNENRYNNPPEKEYTPPPPKKEFRPGQSGGFGGPGGPGGGAGGMGR